LKICATGVVELWGGIRVWPAGRWRSQGRGGFDLGNVFGFEFVGFGFVGFELVVVLVVFEGDAAGPVVGVLQAGEFVGEAFDSFPPGVGVFDFLRVAHGLAEFEEEEAAHGFVGIGAAVVFADLFVFFFEAAEPLESFLVEEPILVAGGAPFGEVLMGDGFAVKYLGEDFFGFGELVDPGEDGAAEFAVVEAAVELFANGGGEAGDFADSSLHMRIIGWWILDRWMGTGFGFYFHFNEQEKLTVMF
jgi:hypothetical protein